MNKENFTLTEEVVNNLFFYNDGKLFWKKPVAKRIKTGDLVGCKNGNGYLRVAIKYKYYYVHRIIFLMHHGYLPKFIDHIDGNRNNNKLENLREATHSENAQNQKTPINNSSGYKNVFWHKTKKSWAVCISLNNKLHHFGNYQNLTDAIQVAKESRNLLHKSFARHL